RYIRFDFPAAADVAAPTTGCSRPAYEAERIGAARIEVTVSCPEAATVALRTTFHPNWQVTVDGTPERTFMVSPSYLAVAVPAGRHVVVAEYRSSASRTPLLVTGALVVVGVIVFRRRVDALVERATPRSRTTGS